MDPGAWPEMRTSRTPPRNDTGRAHAVQIAASPTGGYSDSVSRSAASTRSTRRWLAPAGFGLPLVCVLGVIVLVGLATLTWNTSPYYGRTDAKPPAVDVGTVPTSPATHLSLGTVRSVLVSPKRIVIPKLSAKAPIIKVGTTADGQLDVPLNPRVVGWWSPGKKPGSPTGTAILAGHINYAGVTGTLADIGTLEPGDSVRIYGIDAGHKREITFRIAGVRTYHKTSLPYRKIFDQDGAGRVAIVTCGGPFDASTGNYLDNVVAYAVPASA